MKQNLFSIRTMAVALFALLAMINVSAKDFKIMSPDGKTKALICVEKTISYSVYQDGVEVMKPSAISMTLSNGDVWGLDPKIKKTSRQSVDCIINTPLYKSSSVRENYNELSIRFDNNWEVKFRAYNDGVAYRFVSHRKDKYEVSDEQAEFNFNP